ncbi:hypothetical protein R1flu_017352 [Riccia fluitans]|uniref:Uncharacterized protein n=1 Tax=Riccia fluitans TaxID=41844 RepID=A0ABD1ZG41_9MARC
MQGGTNVIGWNEIAAVFGAKYNDKEDFRSIKVMHMTLDKYNLRANLPILVEHNPNKKLVSGQPYEEVVYYKDAAPYGPTYHLMTTMAELFWSAGRSNRARSNEGGKPIPVVWAPCFVHILFGLRHNLFAGTPLEESEGWRCQLPEEIPIASLEQPVSTRRPRAEDKQQEEFVPASPGTVHVFSKATRGYSHCVARTALVFKKARARDKERGLPSKKKNKDEGQSSEMRVHLGHPTFVPKHTLGGHYAPTSTDLGRNSRSRPVPFSWRT